MGYSSVGLEIFFSLHLMVHLDSVNSPVAPRKAGNWEQKLQVTVLGEGNMTVCRFHICAHGLAVSWLCLSLKPHFDAVYPKTELLATGSNVV